MKTRPLILFLLILVTPACKRRNPLEGTWVIEETSLGRTTTSTTIGADGRYRCEVVARSKSNTVRTIIIEGTLRIENGMLIDTMTNNTSPNVTQFPFVLRAKILRTNEHEMVVSREDSWATRRTKR